MFATVATLLFVPVVFKIAHQRGYKKQGGAERPGTSLAHAPS